MCGDKDQHTRRSELSVGACHLARCRCRDVGAPKKISLVNEVQCGTGTEWRDLIGQHTPAAHSQRLRAEMG